MSLRLRLLGLVAVCGTGWAAEFHVTTEGSPKGDGTAARPWDMATALEHPSSVGPGDTIWLHGGTYRGSFESRLAGRPGSPIVVRQAPGERSTISIVPAPGKGLGLYLSGEHTRYQGFEVVCEDPRRETKIQGSWPADIRRGSVEIRGNHIEAVNLVVHDLANGFGFWSEGEGGEIHGCVIYNNGWMGPDRGHGHAIYTQNERGVKKITDCVMFRQFGEGLHLYGSEKSSLRGYEIEGLVAFDAAARGNGGRNLLMGGGAPVDDIVIRNCLTWGQGVGIQLGYSDEIRNGAVDVTGCYFGGGIRMVFPGRFTVRDNTIIASASLLTIQLSPGQGLGDLSIGRNTYHRTGKAWSPFYILAPAGNRNGGIEVLREAGLDEDSTYAEAAPKKNVIFLRPNRHEAGRGLVVVYNWEQLPAVEVDLGPIVEPGRKFRVVHAQDYFGEAVAVGTQDGKPVVLPMTPRHSVSPVGMEAIEEATSPDFSVFVVLPLGANLSQLSPSA